MNKLDFENFTKEQKSQYAVVFSCLCLHDAGMELNEQSVNNLIKNSGNEVEAYWPGLFLNALEGKDIGDMLAVTGGFEDRGVNQGTEDDDEEKYEEKPYSEGDVDVSMIGLFSD